MLAKQTPKKPENLRLRGTTPFWNESPKIAKARYQATENYVWAFDVNMVKIEVADTTATKAGPPQQHALDNRYTTSHGNFDNFQGPAMEATVDVRLTGPTRGSDSTHRGIDHLELGLVQHVTVAQYSAKYELGGSSFIVQTPLVGKRFVDMITRKLKPGAKAFSLNPADSVVVEREMPWYDSTGLTSGTKLAVSKPGTTEMPLDLEFQISDTPMPQVAPNTVINGHHLAETDVKWQFDVYLAVRTKDEENDANSVYTQRSHMKWEFDASTTYDLGNAQWTAAPSGTDITQQFQEVVTGDRLPDTEGPENGPEVFNDKLGSITWN